MINYTILLLGSSTQEDNNNSAINISDELQFFFSHFENQQTFMMKGRNVLALLRVYDTDSSIRC